MLSQQTWLQLTHTHTHTHKQSIIHVHLYSAEALRVSKVLERRQSVVSKQEGFKITVENVNGE